MGDELTFHPARVDECPAMAQLKYRCIHTIYGHMLRADLMDKNTMDFHVNRLEGYVQDSAYTVTVMEKNGQLAGFAMYGQDPSDPEWGFIEETLYLKENTIDDAHTMLGRIMVDLRKQGFHKVHVWALKNNLVVRYLYEMYGFRMDGQRQVVPIDGEDYLVVRYQYLDEE